MSLDDLNKLSSKLSRQLRSAESSLEQTKKALEQAIVSIEGMRRLLRDEIQKQEIEEIIEGRQVKPSL